MAERYPDFVARFYDTVYAEVRSNVDHDYYVRRMRQAGGAALEIGVGTGRLMADALALGADVWGIDASRAMLERCWARLPPQERHRAWHQDAAELRTDRPFTLALAPFRVLSHIHEPADQIALLDAVHDVLVPGGTFLFDLFVPNLELLRNGLPERCDFDGERSPGSRLRRFVRSEPADLSRQTNRVTMRFEWAEAGAEQHAEWTFEMRFFFRYEIEHLVARSKLRLESIAGDFAGSPLEGDSKEYVVCCRRDG